MLNKTRIYKYTNDIPLFIEEQLVDEDGNSVRLYPYQKTALKEGFSRKEDGTFKYRVVVLCLPRKDGKSFLASAIGVHSLFTKLNQSIPIVAAGGRDQTRIIYKHSRRFVEMNENFNALSRITQRGIFVESLNNELKIMSAEGVSALGWEDNLIIFDELGHLEKPQWKVWYNITTGQGALLGRKKDAIVVVTTTVGDEPENPEDEEHPFYRLYKSCVDDDGNPRPQEEHPETYFYYSNRNLSPLITKKFLEQEKKNLPRHIYSKFYENTYDRKSIDKKLSANLLKLCEEDVPMLLGSPSYDIYIGIDLGQVKDKAAVCVIERIENHLHVREIKYWEPEPLLDNNQELLIDNEGKKITQVDLNFVFNEVESMLYNRYPNFKVCIGDSWNFALQYQNLIRRFGTELVEAKSISSVARMQIFTNFIRLIKSQHLHFPSSEDPIIALFVKQILGISMSGNNYSHSAAGDDLMFACALACWRAVQDMNQAAITEFVEESNKINTYQEDKRSNREQQEIREVDNYPDWEEVNLDYYGRPIPEGSGAIDYEIDPFYR